MTIKKSYTSEDFPPFAVTADLVILTVREGALCVLLIERADEPFAGVEALPGGFVGPEQTLADAARTKLAAKTGVEIAPIHLEQLQTYGEPDRDPRMRVVSVAWLALAADLPEPVAGVDARNARWAPVDEVAADALAFDHARILRDGVERARAKLEYTTLATCFCPPEFTMAELRRVYEAVWGVTLDAANFHRKVLASEGFVEPTGRSAQQGKGRPAQIFGPGSAVELQPPLHRPAKDSEATAAAR